MSALAQRLRSRAWTVPLVAWLVLMLLPVLGASRNSMREILLIATLALIVSGFNLAFGYAGELAVGQVAMYAAGAYVGGVLVARGYDLALALVLSAVAAAVLGLVTAVPGLRLAGWGLAMTSFFLVLLIPDIVDMLATYTGGLPGLSGIASPRLFGSRLGSTGLYVVGLAIAGLWIVVMRNIVLSPHGARFLVLRQSSVLARSLGIDLYRAKLVAYSLAAVPAGLAGCLLASREQFVAPDYFSFAVAISIIAASILGGSQSVYGAIVGAAILEVIATQSTLFQGYAFIAYGAILVIGGAFLAKGVTGLARSAVDRWLPVRSEIPHARPPEDLRAALADAGATGLPLRLAGITKSFSGIRALDDVSMVAEPGEVTGLIGANGSGKTTAINLVTGFYRLDSGAITMGDTRLDGRAPHAIARLGVARTFQTPIVPRTMTTAEVIATARTARRAGSLLSAILRTAGYRRARTADRTEALRIAGLFGLADVADSPAEALPLGRRRLVEVARAVAARPSVLLLDEPASGLDQAEVDHLGRIVRALAASGMTVVLVEHNFELVTRVADRIHVLESGRLLATGDPAAIREDEDVIRSYLGSPAGADGPADIQGDALERQP